MTSEVPPTTEASVSESAAVIERPDTPDPICLKEYFDEKLYPHLSAALAACARDRPEDPVEFVGRFLLNASGKQA